MWSMAQVSHVVTLVYIASYGEDRSCTLYVLWRQEKHQQLYRLKQGTCRQWLFRVILNLGTLSEVVTGLLRTLSYLPYVVFTVFGLLVDYVTRHSSWSVLIFRKPNRRSTFIHCSYHCDSAYWHWEENVANESFSWLKRLTTTWAVIANYAPPLDDFWTNQLVIVGEAPHLSQTGYKACSYVRIHCDNT